MRAVRYSKQRELILNEVRGRHDHPTAESIYSTIKLIAPDISLATVYRNLNFLYEHNEINRLDVGDGKIHFDYQMNSHAHFYCSHCGKIEDLYLNDVDIKNQISLNHRIDKVDIIITGVCEDCLKKEA